MVLEAIQALLQKDTDKVFSYNTKQQVAIRDRTLGITEKIVQLLIAFYLGGFVFYYERGYIETEFTRGQTATHVSGGVVSTSTGGDLEKRHYSAEELTYPNLENGNVFVGTKLVSYNEQRGVCEDTRKSCHTVEDCSPNVGATCSENRYCVEPSWCPASGMRPQTFKMDTDTMKIWIKSTISFTQLVPGKAYFYSSGMSEPILYPQPKYNTLMVRDILMACDPPVRFEEVSELGAAIEVMLYWHCNVDDTRHPCEPQVKARRVDTVLDTDTIGFTYKRAEPMGPDMRHVELRSGIRLYFKTAGSGQKISPSVIIFKLSTGLALLGLAPMIVDFLMLRVFKRSQAYRARKYVITEDFSDFFDQVSLEEMEKAEDSEGEEAACEQQDEEWRREMDDE